MAEKVRKVSVLLQTLSRLPGLGFLADTERQLRTTADEIENVEDKYNDGKRQLDDVKIASRDLRQDD